MTRPGAAGAGGQCGRRESFWCGNSVRCTASGRGDEQGSRKCTLLFYQRRVACRACGLRSVVPMYGLCAADAFALQHNWNFFSTREHLEGNSARAQLLHELDDARDRGARPLRVLPLRVLPLQGDGPPVCGRCRTSPAPARVPDHARNTLHASLEQLAGAVVLFSKCPVLREQDLGPAAKHARGKSRRAGRRMDTKRAVFTKRDLKAGAGPCTVSATPAHVLKAIAGAAGYDRAATRLRQDVLVDSEGPVTVAELCRQLAEHCIEQAPPGLRELLAVGARVPADPGGHLHPDDGLDTRLAADVLTETQVAWLSTLPLRVLRSVKVWRFDAVRDAPLLHALLRDCVVAAKVDKRYKFKSRRYEKQTAKPTGRGLLVRARMIARRDVDCQGIGGAPRLSRARFSRTCKYGHGSGFTGKGRGRGKGARSCRGGGGAPRARAGPAVDDGGTVADDDDDDDCAPDEWACDEDWESRGAEQEREHREASEREALEREAQECDICAQDARAAERDARPQERSAQALKREVCEPLEQEHEAREATKQEHRQALEQEREPLEREREREALERDARERGTWPAHARESEALWSGTSSARAPNVSGPQVSWSSWLLGWFVPRR